MAFYIAFKDIKAFFEREKAVFIWLMVCMTAGAFVLNYSYSAARYDGLIYEHNIGADIPTYKISSQNVPIKMAENILEHIKDEKLPAVKNYQLFAQDNGTSVVGSTYLAEDTADFTGVWVLGYAEEIKNTGENICAVNVELTESAFELKDTTREVRGVPFTIKGAFEDGKNDVVIFVDKFVEIFDSFDNLWINFERKLSGSEVGRLKKIIDESIPNAALSTPPEAGETGEQKVRQAQINYSVIIILMVICLASILKYWQSVNISTYTIYWICGAEKNDILLVSLCETLMLCVPTYFVGLGLNALARLFTVRSAGLHILDIVLGFGIFFITFALSTLVNIERTCKKLNVANIRS